MCVWGGVKITYWNTVSSCVTYLPFSLHLFLLLCWNCLLLGCNLFALFLLSLFLPSLPLHPSSSSSSSFLFSSPSLDNQVCTSNIFYSQSTILCMCVWCVCKGRRRGRVRVCMKNFSNRRVYMFIWCVDVFILQDGRLLFCTTQQLSQ